MKFAALLLIAGLLVFAGCKEDDLTSEPVLKFKNNDYSKDMRLNQLTDVELEVTDKEGDVADTFYIIKQVTNRNRPRTDTLARDPLPTHPTSTKNDLVVKLINAQLRPPGSSMIEVAPTVGTDPDTTIMKFFLVDKTKKRSNILSTETILIRRN